ncbi:MAG: flagellar filament capping protein FliD, partial [Epsilonproteobacteria bacterium]|nr:flagellar filament capping protein FliD [Campylobacterota bacterium]
TLKGNATLSDLRDAINSANAGVTASIIDTGIGDNPYKLVLKANETGKDNIIKFDFSKIDDLGLNATEYTSKVYDADTDSVNDTGSTQTFKITVNGTDYTMDVADGTSVSDFIDAINNGELKDSDGNSLGISADYVDGQIKFNLQAIGDISIDDSGLNTAFNDNTDFTNANRLQTAQDALFSYNGVDVERSSNEVKDLIPGVTINLQETGKSSVNINNNVDSVIDAVKKFVADYNQMITNLQSLTDYDKEAGTVGLFQGNSDFTMLESRFNNDLFGVVMSSKGERIDAMGNTYEVNTIFTAADVGFSLNRNGMLSFDEEKFKEAYNKDPDLTQRFFETAFTNLKTDFERTITDDKSNLNLLDQQIKNEQDGYEDRIKAMKQYLETKYEIMAKQFAAYDETINKFNAMSSTLTMAIQQAINSK